MPREEGQRRIQGLDILDISGGRKILAMVIIRLLRLLEVWMSCYRGNCVFG